MRQNTLLLDTEKWDIVIDSLGNIAMARPPYSMAQDVASAARLIKGELNYQRNKGSPYFNTVLGHAPPASLVKGYLEKAALSVPGVVSCRIVFPPLSDRTQGGQILFIDEEGVTHGVQF